MEEICTNIYKLSRKNAGIEQGDAADALGVSIRSLQNYESDLSPSIPQLDVVRNMVILYKDRSLAYKHIKKSPIGEFMPELSQQTLPVATLGVVDDINNFNEVLDKLVSITRDGHITDDEVTDWKEIINKGIRLMNSMNTLINAKGGEI